MIQIEIFVRCCRCTKLRGHGDSCICRILKSKKKKVILIVIVFIDFTQRRSLFPVGKYSFYRRSPLALLFIVFLLSYKGKNWDGVNKITIMKCYVFPNEWESRASRANCESDRCNASSAKFLVCLRAVGKQLFDVFKVEGRRNVV